MTITGLAEYSSTFPTTPTISEIPLDSKIRELLNKFGPDHQCIVLHGASGSGKTIHLSQFSKTLSENSFTYFLTDNYWSLRQSALLLSLCKQMSIKLGLDFLGKTSNFDNMSIDIERLKIMFDTLTDKVIEYGKIHKTPFYFVIDGLEWAFQGISGERIIDIFPLRTHPKWLFLLGSVNSSSSQQLSFAHLQEEPHLFSSLETEKYLDDLSLKQEDLAEIHKSSGGMPGYLSIMHKLITENNIPLRQILEAPAEADALLQIQWNTSATKCSETTRKALALIAFSLTPLKTFILGKILGIDETEISGDVTNTGLVKYISKSEVQFHPEVLKSIAQNRLKSLRKESLSLLIKYYEQFIQEKETNYLLPEYYRQAGNYPGLSKLLTPQYLVTVIRDNKDLTIAKRDLRQASEMAKDAGDLTSLLQFTLACSQLNHLSNDLIGETEVRALVAMKQFESALELAYSAKLTISVIKFLSYIYLAMEKNGVTVTRQAINELEQMVNNIGDDLETEDVLNLASDIFPLLPDKATALIDKATGNEHEQSPIDLIATLATLTHKSPPHQGFVDRIKNPELRAFALASSGLENISADEILRKVASTRQTKAKEHLLRQWCLKNKGNSDIHIVVDAALDAINSDSEYKVPLRNLRQLSEALIGCHSSEKERLVKRFDVPSFTSLRSPIEERLRLELNLAEAMLDIDSSVAIERFTISYTELLQTPLDVDVACYCYARLLISLETLDPEDKLRQKPNIKRKLEDEFLRLLDTSAEQLDISRKTLRALSMVEPDLALAFADMLNMVERREEGIQTILETYLRQDRLKLNVQFVEAALKKISERSIREETILRAITEARSSGKINDQSLRQLLIQVAQTIEDPIIICQCLARLISTLDTTSHKDQIAQLYTKLLNAWEKLDIIWLRVELGFDLVSDIAMCDQIYAADLYERAKALRQVSPLANQPVGVILYQTLELCVRVASRLDKSKDEAKFIWDQLVKLIDGVPSRLLQANLTAILATGCLRAGDKTTFDNLIRGRVLTGLRLAGPSSQRDEIISKVSLAVFEYSPEEAKVILDPLPYLLRNEAWVNLAFHVLRHTNVNDPISVTEMPNMPIDLQCANKILYILENMEQDQSISHVVEAFTHAIENPGSQLIEQQRLDILVKLEALLELKLPDRRNINHTGYKILCKSQIERARRHSAKRAKHLISKTHKQISVDALQLENIADRVFVLALIAKEFREIEGELANDLISQAMSLTPRISNARDRIERLETIAEVYSKLRNTDKATEAIRIACQLAHSLIGLDRDKILASVIQTAHQFDPKLAATLTEKIEMPNRREAINKSLVSANLAKAPQKLRTQYAEFVGDDEVVARAADEMLTALMNGRGVSHPRGIILEWLSAVQHLRFRSSIKIVQWGVETLLQQSPNSNRSLTAVTLINSLIQSSTFILQLGSGLAFLSSIPDDLRPNFQGFSTNAHLFKIGERDKAIKWVKEWLQTNAQEYVKICDPYFDAGQLWVLQAIPTDVEVKLVTTGNQLDIRRNALLADPASERERLKQDKNAVIHKLQQSWADMSNQSPPPVLVVIHRYIYGSEETDAFHDRYITTANSGLSLGTSLNGFGNKEFIITVLGYEDTKHIDEVYIDPKLDIQKLFSKIIYFEID